MGNDISYISIEQLEFLRDQHYVWLCNTRIDHPWYNKVRDEYEMYNNKVIEYYDKKKDRNNKIVVALLTGATSLVSIVTIGVISNSSWGAKFGNGLKTSSRFIG
jgi:hypothetical protein